ncbi:MULTISPECIES: phosphoglucosamine mutase [unclassified Planococcus (in: firmicutes)]|uniref:phosphoglucosamine mutase n=1 Tax=unclassified Planococcus (in: firmicutes) TaxID=2662419 RepID=UPI000C332DED|nr:MULTISPECIES: phosphoglucosamine mutase [unclassified Planococcus (in: firmicutes)]AUD12661.1 phosphoglucosamine mutase [Planococcus sp. MB-3u-03]PKG46810.1 phosphoglucosamine mutase [Planococcus sp. Urea-trap-24]PKG89655.1 phosphoglucosamine mutase [Planococcus sp. Urea-3u-39]PKH36036.1 phosphoglucosamine mutase [Planococcus sp. MB-3u-09]
MGKYFGTDGVRGVANSELTPELAFKLGRFGGYVLTKSSKEKPKVLVGRDTRISGEMLENALAAGLLSVGAEVMRLGVISTPGVSYLTRVMSAEAGVMISASHNPVADNGIKFFGSDGFKLSDDQEAEIEALLDAETDDLPRPTGGDLGSITEYFEGGQKYIQYLKQTVDEEFDGIHVALDCAHGATSTLATHVFADLDADISSMGASPNGLNINEGVGSTHPEALAKLVVDKGADVGLAFDGDGDRLIAVDEKGTIVDGDQIMYICAKHLKSEGRLKQDTVVSTIMSNMGFYKALEENDMKSVKTAVGDRYVVEEMKKNEYNLGGEQSGHIIFLDYNTTGDGLLSGLQLVNIMKITGKKLSELANEMTIFPQKLVNIRVTDKHGVTDNAVVAKKIAEVERDMDGDGRVLVRPSGTEPLVRVMVEAPSAEACEEYVERIAAVVREEMGMK